MGRPGIRASPAAVPVANAAVGGWPWCLPHVSGALLSVHAQPRASRAEIAGLHGAALKIRVPGAPVDGQANAELQRFLAAVLGVSRSAVELVRGATGRRKQFLIHGRAPAEIARRLLNGGRL